MAVAGQQGSCFCAPGPLARHLNETSETWRSEAKQCALAMGRSRDQDGSGARQIPWMEGLQALGGVFLFVYDYL